MIKKDLRLTLLKQETFRYGTSKRAYIKLDPILGFNLM